MKQQGYRAAIEEFIRANAKPVDKFSHQARLYLLATALAGNQKFDDDVLHAAAWMHDLGVFIGHRPETPAELAAWDHIVYAASHVPKILANVGFPTDKIAAVIRAIEAHLPSGEPDSFEGLLLRDADILEQLGAVGILRVVSKVGRDTRFARFSDALKVLRKNMQELPGRLKLDSARRLAQPRLQVIARFLEASESEGDSIPW